VTDNEGRKVGFEQGKNLRGVPGAYAFTLADSKYVVVPEGEYEVKILGYASSTFSLTIDELIGDTQTKQVDFSYLPTNLDSLASFTLGEEFSDILIDIDGDGKEDIIVDSKTGIIRELDKKILIAEPSPKSSSGTRVMTRAAPLGLVAGATISTGYDQEYLRLLEQLIKIIQLYLSLIER
jgi:hypothetical protein